MNNTDGVGLTEQHSRWLEDAFIEESERLTAEYGPSNEAFQEGMAVAAVALITTIMKTFDASYREADLAAAAVIARVNRRLSGAANH